MSPARLDLVSGVGVFSVDSPPAPTRAVVEVVERVWADGLEHCSCDNTAVTCGAVPVSRNLRAHLWPKTPAPAHRPPGTWAGAPKTPGIRTALIQKGPFLRGGGSLQGAPPDPRGAPPCETRRVPTPARQPGQQGEARGVRGETSPPRGYHIRSPTFRLSGGFRNSTGTYARPQEAGRRQ